LSVRHTGPVVPIASVVIPAHNEEAVIGRCLDVLLADALPGEFEVVVAANGCRDATAAAALSRHPDITVLDLPAPGKPGALNAADASATTFPRIYLDADVELTTAVARELATILAEDGVLVAAPTPAPATDRSPLLVRWYYETWAQSPVINDAYVGSGVFAVSAEGHDRITPFPDLIADDQYVRRRFRRQERRQLPARFVVHTPTDVSSLVHRAVRSRAGNVQLAQSGVELQREESPRSTAALSHLLGPPSTWPRTAAFVGLTCLIRWRAGTKLRRGDLAWNRDESSRRTVGTAEERRP
jgi:glycosyltransferase involved in cell wall biosynthesis